jgi:hypothetical protein
MNLKTSNVVQGVIGLVSLGVLAMAGQWWISQEVSSQLAEVSIPDTAQLTTDVEVIKSTVLAIDDKADTAIESQQRFEEIFTEYLINEANR